MATKLKIYYCNTFRGFKDNTKTAAIIIAENKHYATYILEEELRKLGIPQKLTHYQIQEISTKFNDVIMLSTGE